MPVEISQGIIPYSDIQSVVNSSGRCHLLLGNGFSSGCDPVFTYGSLYEAAVKAGLSERAQQLFAYLGTNNFEGVMRLLDDSHFVARTYGLVDHHSSGMLDDLEIVKHALVEAVANSHLEHTGDVEDSKKMSAARFIEPFHNVFTTNYDLLTYWVNMAAFTPPLYQDGFREDEDNPDAPSVVFSEPLGDNTGLFYLHGALHLFSSKGALRKHCWKRSGKRLTDQILAALATGGYPLFVAEGDPEKKLEQIRKNAYLSYALGKFGRIKGPLIVFGHSLGLSDGHIVDAIANNEKLPALYVGLFDSFESENSVKTRQSVDAIARKWEEQASRTRRPSKRSIVFYDSKSVNCWDSSVETRST